MSSFIHERLSLVFVHVPKTGGQTVAAAFSRGRREAWRNGFAFLNDGLPIHAGIAEIVPRLSRPADDYFSFAYFRNSWDWLFSLYRYIGRSPGHDHYGRVAGLSFEDFVLHHARHIYRPQMPLVTIDDRCAVTDLNDFRDFPTSFATLLDRLGFDDLGFQSANVAPERIDYKSVYNRATIKAVHKLYARDIEWFGFRFGE